MRRASWLKPRRSLSSTCSNIRIRPDGLADIALAKNDSKTAIGLFEASLRIDPDNEYAVEALARLRSAGAKTASKR
ncbi:MAG: hypothetical protein H0X53_01855 [Sphingomonas sp.]|nr:hypothetical protein [Sphingomonas sp.]